MSNNIVQFNEEIIKGQIKELVRGSVEETLNSLLEEEAEKLTQAARYGGSVLSPVLLKCSASNAAELSVEASSTKMTST